VSGIDDLQQVLTEDRMGKLVKRWCCGMVDPWPSLLRHMSVLLFPNR